MRKGGLMSDSMALPLAEARAPDDMDDDAALVARARADPAAFGALYERYLDRIYAYLRARASTPEEAADLTQHVFLHAFDALDGYRLRRASFATWLFRIARNAATDAHRRRKETIAWDLLPPASQPATDDDPEAGALRREARDRLRLVLAACDARTREVLALRYGAGLSVAEVAAVVGRSEAAVKKQLTRALRALKEQYDDEP